MAAGRKKLLTVISAIPFDVCILFELNCLAHQFHIICGDFQDELNDIFKELGIKLNFFSALAKIVHSWRNLAEFICNTFDKSHFASKALPPCPLSGRFGCCHYLETFLRAVGLVSVHAHLYRAYVDSKNAKGHKCARDLFLGHDNEGDAVDAATNPEIIEHIQDRTVC